MIPTWSGPRRLFDSEVLLSAGSTCSVFLVYIIFVRDSVHFLMIFWFRTKRQIADVVISSLCFALATHALKTTEENCSYHVHRDLNYIVFTSPSWRGVCSHDKEQKKQKKTEEMFLLYMLIKHLQQENLLCQGNLFWGLPTGA